MITLAQLLEANGEGHRYAFIRDKHLVPLDPSLPEFPMSDRVKIKDIDGDSEKIWYVTKADNRERWLVVSTNYSNLEEFVKNHKFTITMEELESLVASEVKLEEFRREHCVACGSQRCDGSQEWLKGCEKWRKYQNE